MLNSDMPNALAILRLMYLPSRLPIILNTGTFVLIVKVTRRPDFVACSIC